MNNRLLKEEKGSALVLFALGLTVFLGISAIVIDAGLLYVTRSRMQNAVDAAALAGAQELPYRVSSALITAEDYGVANGLEGERLTVEILNQNTTIKVSSERNVEFFFAKFMGFNSGKVAESAVAQVGPVVGVGGAVPLGIEEEIFEIGKEYTLKVGAGESEEGWFGALALNKPGASNYEYNLTYGFQDIIRVGDILDIQTGNISNPTYRAIDYRIEQCTHIPTCTVEAFDRNCERLIKVPVIEFINHKQVKVIGFSMFLVDQVMGQGNESFITGKFVKTVTSGEIDFSGKDFGLSAVKLTQ